MTKIDEFSATEHNRQVQSLLDVIEKFRPLTEVEQFLIDVPAGNPVDVRVHVALICELSQKIIEASTLMVQATAELV